MSGQEAPSAATRCPKTSRRTPSAATVDLHDLAVEYIDRSISCQVALGYGPPTAERRLAAIEKAEREFWKLRELTSPGVEVAPAAPSEGTQPRSADSGVSTPGSSAATVDQLEVVPTPGCDFCGHLAWTIERFGRLTHKCACPYRIHSYCQAHPSVCDDFTDIRNEAWRKSYQISELRGETWDDEFGGAA